MARSVRYGLLRPRMSAVRVSSTARRVALEAPRALGSLVYVVYVVVEFLSFSTRGERWNR